MVRSLSSVLTWQTLRALVRSGVPMTGRQLRLDRSRRTRDGTFLDALVTEGLLEVVEKGGPAPSRHGPAEPVQFRTVYRLTVAGAHAAEYGEYECPDINPIPVREPAAQRGPAGRGRHVRSG